MCRALFSFPLIPVDKTRAAEILYHEEEWLSHSQCAGEAGLAGSSGQGKQSQESSSCAGRMLLCPGKCLTQLEVAAGITQPGHSPCAQSCPPVSLAPWASRSIYTQGAASVCRASGSHSKVSLSSKPAATLCTLTASS